MAAPRLILAVLAAATIAPFSTAPAASPSVVTWPVDEATTGYVLEDHRTPLVFLRVELAAGRWAPWSGTVPAREAFETQLLAEGGALRARADALSMEVSLVFGRRVSVLTASFPRDELEAAVALAGEILRAGEVRKPELKRRKRGRQVSWAGALKEPGFRARQAEATLLFAEGDPRRREYETPRQLVTDAGKLRAARDLLVRLPGRAVGLAGDVTATEARKLAAGLLPAALGDEDDRPRLEPRLAATAPREERGGEVVVGMKGLTQVYFRLVRPSLPWTDPDYPALLIANHVLGGHFHSRLSEALRHEGGETYGAGTEMRGSLEAGPYALWTSTRAGNAATAEAKLRRVLAELHEGGITEDERAAAAGHLLGSQPFRRQSPDQILAQHMRDVRLGLEPGYRDAVEERAAALPLETVNAFVRRFYDPALFTLIRVAPPDDGRRGGKVRKSRESPPSR